MATDHHHHQESPTPTTDEPPPHHHQPPKMTEHEAAKSPTKPHKERGGGFFRRYGYRYSDGYYRLGNGRRQGLCMLLVVLLLLVGITALTLWLLYRPHDPKFRVVSASVYQLNATVTPAPMLSTTMQFTVVTRNPNSRVSISYDHLSAFVSYRNQPITPPLILPPLIHETKSTVALSPVIGGAVAFPVADEVVNGLMMDEDAYGVVGLSLVVTGRLRYRGGPVSGRHRGVYVRCDMYVGLKRGFVGQLPLLGSPPCAVNVY